MVGLFQYESPTHQLALIYYDIDEPYPMTSPSENTFSLINKTTLGAIEVSPICAFDDNYIWYIDDTETDQCWIVDPGAAEPVLKTLKSLDTKVLSGILVTHHHHDHIGGIDEILKAYPETPVYGVKSDRVPQVSNPVKEGDVLELSENLKLEVISVTGHTRDHIAYFCNEPSYPFLFSGDTLFVAGCGRLFEGTPEQMLNSLKKLKALPEKTVNFCAHEYTLNNLKFAEATEPSNEDIQNFKSLCLELRKDKTPTVPTTLQQEMSINPFLRWNAPAVIAKAQELADKETLNDIDVFTQIRSWKDRF